MATWHCSATSRLERTSRLCKVSFLWIYLTFSTSLFARAYWLATIILIKTPWRETGLRSDIVSRSAVDGTISTRLYEDFKRSYVNTESSCQEEGITFIHVVCEADGG